MNSDNNIGLLRVVEHNSDEPIKESNVISIDGTSFRIVLKSVEIKEGKRWAYYDFDYVIPNKRNYLASRIQYLIPSKRREEVIGDLLETETQMIQEGIPNWKIKLTILFHTTCIVFSLFRTKLSDYGYIKKTKV